MSPDLPSGVWRSVPFDISSKRREIADETGERCIRLSFEWTAHRVVSFSPKRQPTIVTLDEHNPSNDLPVIALSRTQPFVDVSPFAAIALWRTQPIRATTAFRDHRYYREHRSFSWSQPFRSRTGTFTDVALSRQQPFDDHSPFP